jgi:hypothetical protein
MKVIEHARDPVFVDATSGRVIELRIGEPRVGETRYALLSPNEAAVVAYALLTAAERIRMPKEPQ